MAPSPTGSTPRRWPATVSKSWRAGAPLARKQAGIACYASQVLSEDGNRPVLPASFLAHFARPVEVFLPPQVIGGQASRHSSPVYGGR